MDALSSSGFVNPVNQNGTGMGVPFMNLMPQNMINPTYGSQVYNPQVGALFGTNLSPFFGPNNTLSGQFGTYSPNPALPPPPPGFASSGR